jgi:hypothetical protein
LECQKKILKYGVDNLLLNRQKDKQEKEKEQSKIRKIKNTFDVDQYQLNHLVDAVYKKENAPDMEYHEFNQKSDDIELIVQDFSKVDNDMRFFMQYVKELDDILIQLKKDIQNLKNKEIRRISQEFLVNDYERRFKVNIETLICSIVGKRDSLLEMRHIMNEKYKYCEDLKSCRNYDCNLDDNFDKIFKNLFYKNNEPFYPEIK